MCVCVCLWGQVKGRKEKDHDLEKKCLTSDSATDDFWLYKKKSIIKKNNKKKCDNKKCQNISATYSSFHLFSVITSPSGWEEKLTYTVPAMKLKSSLIIIKHLKATLHRIC